MAMGALLGGGLGVSSGDVGLEIPFEVGGKVSVAKTGKSGKASRGIVGAVVGAGIGYVGAIIYEFVKNPLGGAGGVLNPFNDLNKVLTTAQNAGTSTFINSNAGIWYQVPSPTSKGVVGPTYSKITDPNAFANWEKTVPQGNPISNALTGLSYIAINPIGTVLTDVGGLFGGKAPPPNTNPYTYNPILQAFGINQGAVSGGTGALPSSNPVAPVNPLTSALTSAAGDVTNGVKDFTSAISGGLSSLTGGIL